MLSGNSPYDKYKAGDENALSDVQKKGMELFEDAGCSTCHTPPLFSNYRYYNAGIGAEKETLDEGRKAVTGEERDLGKFRVPARKWPTPGLTSTMEVSPRWSKRSPSWRAAGSTTRISPR